MGQERNSFCLYQCSYVTISTFLNSPNLKLGKTKGVSPKKGFKNPYFPGICLNKLGIYISWLNQQGLTTEKLPIRVWAICQTIVIVRNTEVKIFWTNKNLAIYPISSADGYITFTFSF